MGQGAKREQQCVMLLLLSLAHASLLGSQTERNRDSKKAGQNGWGARFFVSLDGLIPFCHPG
jgi:hypothetical protein